MLVKGHFVRGSSSTSAKHLSAHLRYLEHRARDEERETPEDRSLFSRERDQVERREAVEDIMSHTSTSVNYHKLTLSPASDEPVEDYRLWTREVMADLEEQQGKTLHWYAAVHANTGHPHVHVVLAGSGEDWETGREEAVKLYREDYQFLHESATEHSEHDWYTQLMESLQQFHERDTLIPDAHGFLEEYERNEKVMMDLDDGKDFEP